MKDLKHLIYFENLLQEADNDLVKEAEAEGQKCIGVTCRQVPEVLLNLPGCFSTRLFAPRTGSIDIGTYYMTSLTCEYCRAILERALEGGYQYLDCYVNPCACSQNNDLADNIEQLEACTKPGFFMLHMDTPMKSDANGVNHMYKQCKTELLPALQRLGIDTSDEALRTGVEDYNEMCRVLKEIGDHRKDDNPNITGYEYFVLCLATYVCPKDKIMDKLKETAEELKTRVPDPDMHKKYRARVLMVGSEIDDVNFIKTVEDSGALIVADRFCYGTFPDREEIVLNDEEDVLFQICRDNVMSCMCPRYMNTERILERKEYIDKLAREFKADGIIVQQMKFCNFWAYERADYQHVFPEEYGWPVLSIDRAYSSGASGQLRTRVQAFIESLEIKKIQKNKLEGGESA